MSPGSCDGWCITAIVMIVLLSLGFIAALYRLYSSSRSTLPPKPPQAVPAATPRPPRPVRSNRITVNPSGHHYQPITPVLQANPYQTGSGNVVPVLVQASPYEAGGTGMEIPPAYNDVVTMGGDELRLQGAGAAPSHHVVDVVAVLGSPPSASGSGEKRKKKKKKAIRISTGEQSAVAQPLLQPDSRPTGPVV